LRFAKKSGNNLQNSQKQIDKNTGPSTFTRSLKAFGMSRLKISGSIEVVRMFIHGVLSKLRAAQNNISVLVNRDGLK
jgi:hypothetical protein